ncbi:phosphodiester glycosidase family protein [Myxococcota bacterium]|nr:phosphodiester glycosidase family protein [Myxococcota bacterium]
MKLHALRPRRTELPPPAVVERADATPVQGAERDRRAIARLLGTKKVQRAIVGVTVGASSLTIPLLAHHPGAPSQPLVPARPVVTADPFPGTPLVPADPSTPITVPATPAPAEPVVTAPPAPVERAPLAANFPSLSGIRDVSLTRPHAGIQYLRLTANGPQQLHVVEVDLTRSDLRVRTTKADERNKTVSQFAEATGALVAINGDWFSYESYFPRGLAMGEGEQWPGVQDLADWLFLACDAANQCTIDGEGGPTPVDPAWKSVVGGNGVPLVVDGQPRINEDAFYSVDRHPRSAVGLTRDGRMFLVAAEGRQGDAAGMTFNEMARLLADLGAERAMMLDGGGSTSLVIAGHRVSDLPSGSGERSVSNHLAILPA